MIGTRSTSRVTRRCHNWSICCIVSTASDFLHRIEFAKIAPVEGNLLALNFTVEAISMPDADKDRILSARASDRLAFDKIEDYQNAIVRRNFYPAQSAPEFHVVQFPKRSRG